MPPEQLATEPHPPAYTPADGPGYAPQELGRVARRSAKAVAGSALLLGARIVVDLALLLLAAVIVRGVSGPSALPWSVLPVIVPVILAVLVVRGSSHAADQIGSGFWTDVKIAAEATAVGSFVAVLYGAASSSVPEPSAVEVLFFWAVATATLGVPHGIHRSAVRHRRPGLPTVIVGAGEVGQVVARRLLGQPELGLQPVGFLDRDPKLSADELPAAILGPTSDLDEIARTHNVRCAVIAFSNAGHDELLELLDDCKRLNLRAFIVPRLFERVPSRLHVTHLGALPLIETMPTGPGDVQYVIKYALDRLISLAVVAFLAPLLAVITLGVLVSLGRPILYRQQRVGLDGCPFEILKFRTMREAPREESSEGAGRVPAAGDLAPGGVEGDDRRTRFGGFLRRTSLDELPQLFNVLRGDMSLVGPRPERPEYVAHFSDHVRRYSARHRVRSGITGWAQVHGLRGKTSISDRAEWDNYYIENFSLWLDLKILLLTIPEVFRGRAE